MDVPRRREQRIPMTYDEYLAWPVDGSQVEWVDGEAIVFAPQTVAQAESKGFFLILLGCIARYRSAGETLMAPFEMRLSRRCSREPDLVFIAAKHRHRLTEARLEGPADLAVEIVSDESVDRDRVEKFEEYAISGVQEYWIHDPRPGEQRSDFYRLTADGRYEPIEPDAEGRVRSGVLPGFWLRPAWLRQDPLPDPLDCLNDIAPDLLASVATGRPAPAT
jgi:Uma2 family endonuclease